MKWHVGLRGTQIWAEVLVAGEILLHIVDVLGEQSVDVSQLWWSLSRFPRFQHLQRLRSVVLRLFHLIPEREIGTVGRKEDKRQEETNILLRRCTSSFEVFARPAMLELLNLVAVSVYRKGEVGPCRTRSSFWFPWCRKSAALPLILELNRCEYSSPWM